MSRKQLDIVQANFGFLSESDQAKVASLVLQLLDEDQLTNPQPEEKSDEERFDEDTYRVAVYDTPVEDRVVFELVKAVSMIVPSFQPEAIKRFLHHMDGGTLLMTATEVCKLRQLAEEYDFTVTSIKID